MESNLSETRHPRGHRRLDLRALAQQLLPGRLAPGAASWSTPAGKLTAIEVNGTYYSSKKPATFAKWRDETPDGFVFSLKANRFATNRRVLAEAGESVQRFIGSGIAELGTSSGPIFWQFAPTKRFEAADFEAFLKLLPAQVDGLPLRHVLDVRHESFKTPRVPGTGPPPRHDDGLHRLRRLPALRRPHGRLRVRALDALRASARAGLRARVLASSPPAHGLGGWRAGACRV